MGKKIDYELEALTSYLVLLFYKSKKKYSCTRQKIGKLLALNTLCNIYNSKMLDTLYMDDETIYTSFPGMLDFIYRDIYIKYPISDDKKEFTEPFDESIKIPDMFKTRIDRYKLDDYSKKLLEDIFRKFASYPTSDLNKMINEILPIIKQIMRTKNYILKESDYLYNHYKKQKYELIFSDYNINGKYKDNKVFLFLKSHIFNEIEDIKDKYSNNLSKQLTKKL